MSEIETVVGTSGERAESRIGSRRLVAGYSSDALLHRMLAAADTLTIAASAVIVGLWGSGASGAFLLVLSAPIWIVIGKLVGLYDRDHRTLRHLTVEELPWIFVWALGGTAVLTFLLAPFPSLDLSSDDRLFVWGSVLLLGFVFRGLAFLLFVPFMLLLGGGLLFLIGLPLLLTVLVAAAPAVLFVLAIVWLAKKTVRRAAA